MSKTEATPRPWIVRKLHDGSPFVEAPKELINKPYGQEILADDYFDDLNKEADCELIVKAVNNYDRLVDTLEESKEDIISWCNSVGLDYYTYPTVMKIESLLKELKP